ASSNVVETTRIAKHARKAPPEGAGKRATRTSTPTSASHEPAVASTTGGPRKSHGSAPHGQVMRGFPVAEPRSTTGARSSAPAAHAATIVHECASWPTLGSRTYGTIHAT